MGIIPCEIPLLEFDPEQTAVIGPDYEQLDLHLPREMRVRLSRRLH